jgi:hypothetical protein
MLRSIVGAAAALLFLILPAAALADPVTWTLNGVTFDDGGAASGSFVYDADTNTYSNVNITTTAGTVRTSGATYVAPSTALPSDANALVAQTSGGAVSGEAFLQLVPDFSLTNAGGTVAIARLQAERTCSNTPCTASGAPFREIRSGSIIGVPAAVAVPTLSEWALILFGLVLAVGAALYIQRRQLIA